jgi:hypothetical protein
LQRKRLVLILSSLILLAILVFGGYHFYEWRQLQLKRKELFVYFQKESPVTKRIPADAFLYLNLFDFNRVHDGLQNTNLNKVLSHWLDTGMANDQPANPLLGGMLEKTILNVIGQEFVLSLLPATEGKIDLFAVARLAPGSDFLLKLALSADRKVKQIEEGDHLFYVFETKLLEYPQVYLLIEDDLAYASNRIERIRQSSSQEGTGPEFLSGLEVQAIPEDTFLFLQVKQPKVSGVLHGGKLIYSVEVSIPETTDMKGRLPQLDEKTSGVFSIQTNGTEIFQQPATAYDLHNVDNVPASVMFLGFDQPSGAHEYQNKVLIQLTKPATFQLIQTLNLDGMDCRFISSENLYVCLRGQDVVIAEGEKVLRLSEAKLKTIKEQNSPLQVELHFNRQPIEHYFKMVEEADWSHFQKENIFYFLSCLKQVQGSIEGENSAITFEIL